MMASISLCLSLTLFFSTSFTTATVHIFQDGTVCGGMSVNVTCITTTATGFLQWSINKVPVYTIIASSIVNDSVSINGSEFVFTDRATVPNGTANVFASTASLNTSHVTSIQCSDGSSVGQLSLKIQTEVFLSVNFKSVKIIKNAVEVSWAPPPNASVCCERYHVRTPDGTMFNTTMTNYTLNNITTSEQRQYVSISVSCLDPLNNMGPVTTYRLPSLPRTLPFVNVSIPEPVEDPCSGGYIMFRVDFSIMEPNFGNISQLTSCNAINIEPADCVTFVNCSIEDRVAYFTSDGLLSFNVTINFTDQYGITNNNTHLSQFNSTDNEAVCRGQKWHTTGLALIPTFILYAGASIVVIGKLSHTIHKLKKKLKNTDPKVAVHLDMEVQEEDIKM